MNISSNISTASHRRNPYQGGHRGPVYQAPRPTFPPQYGYQPRPYYPPQMPYYPNPYWGRPSVASQVWHGFTERLQEVTQVALHPFNPYARRMPYDMYRPRTDAENVGRWVVNLGLLGGAVVLGGALLGNGFSLGGIGAAIGMS
jgi:hypothetical protein